MPNWCNTRYRICGEKESIKKIITAVEVVKKDNDGRSPWLWDILEHIGIDMAKHQRGIANYRGYVYNMECPDEETVELYCDTAWSESDGFRHALINQFEDIDIVYTAVENGMGIYATNDDGIDGQYYFESVCDSGFADEEDVVGHFSSVMPEEKIKDIDDVYDAISRHNHNPDVEYYFVCEQMTYCED